MSGRGERVWGVLLVALALFSCERCSRPPAAPVNDTGLPGQTRATDLRTALMTIFPEIRGATVTAGYAQLSRELDWQPPAGTSLAQALAGPMAAKGFAPPDGGEAELIGVRSSFTLHATRRGGHVVVSIRLPLENTQVTELYQSPAPLSTETMATYLAVPKGARPVSETFVLAIDYAGREERVDFLVRQLVDMLVAGYWTASKLPEGWEPTRRPDGGVGGVPASFELTLNRAAPATEIHIERDGPRVHVELLQPTWP
ncbi:MAG: hypothetical protein ACYC8T_32675 [Myxococcaceae bacterium]